MTRRYPTDLRDDQWQYIKKTLQLDNRKRKHDLREVWNAIIYLVKTGCQWRMLPRDYPKWPSVYYYYKKWEHRLDYDLLLQSLREKVRTNMGQAARPSLGIVDSQSVRWGNNKATNGYDGNKKVKGIKRHTVVDKNGFLIAVVVTAANIYDGKAVGQLMGVLKELLSSVKVIIADSGYRGDIIEQVRKTFGYILKIVMRTDEKNGEFLPVKKRWVVERTFSWFDNDRRLCRNYELLIETSEAMVKLAAIKLLLNKI